MRSFFTRLGASQLIVLLLFLAVPSIVFADPTDSGSITVTGTVAPQPTSISTSLSVSPDQETVHQEEKLTYTLSYSSANVGTVPLTLVAEWGKGKVEGATEANVEAVSYVIGSATQAYGSTPAVIDPLHKTITWSIPALPSGVGTQSVTFKLQTTANYTGSLPVEIPVVAKVLSPSGVSDKTVTSTYQYAAPNVDETQSEIEEESESIATTTTPNPTIKPAGKKGVNASAFKGISVVAIGKTSAKLSVKTNLPTPLVVQYGMTPEAAEISLKENTTTLDHAVYISQLHPASKYYLTVSSVSADAVEVSDIFTFTTASADSTTVERKAQTVTVSQNRALIFSGSAQVSQTETELPISVVKNSVIDLNVGLENSQDILSVEVEVRAADVLGVTTDSVSVDELQSQTTKMTEIMPGIFVGKLRTPVRVGRYQLISRIEDIYGNLSEDEIGELYVGSPMKITNLKTGQAVEHAAARIFVYDQQTKLFEPLSNLTTSVANPAFSNGEGIVQIQLYPAKYRVEVTALGYSSASAEFEIGNQEIEQFPQIELEPLGIPFLISLGATINSYQNLTYTLFQSLAELSESENLLTSMMWTNMLLVIALSVSIWWTKKNQFQILERAKQKRWFEVVWFGLSEVFRFIISLYICLSILVNYFFLQHLEQAQVWSFTGLTVVVLVIWLKFWWQFRKRAAD
jgi:hypothetical protein